MCDLCGNASAVRGISWGTVVPGLPPGLGDSACLLGGGVDGGAQGGVVCQLFLMGSEARFQNSVVEILRVPYYHGYDF